MFDYTLVLSTASTFDTITSTLATLLGVQDLSEVQERYPGFFVDADEASHPVQEIVYKRFLGTSAAASVRYSMNYHDRDQLWQFDRLMAVSATSLAVETDALAFMTFSVDSLIMRRTDGVLYLYENFGNTWREPEVISQIPRPWIMTADEHEGTPPGGSPYG